MPALAAAERLCWLDGRILPLAEARISPLDRAFLFGDAVYETVKVRDGRPLFLDRHLERLGRSLAAMRIAEPEGVRAAIGAVLEASALASGAVYLQISRGAPETRRHLPPPGLAPTLFVLPVEIADAAEPWREPGLNGISRRDDRWGRCDVKTTALAASVLGGLAAHDEGADEVVWVSADGELLEGGHTSLFVRDLAGWHTAPLSASILPGVTRALLLGLGRADGIAIEERAPRLAERAHWREAFLCGTTTGVRGLAALDGAPIGDGRPGAETIHFARLLDAAERREAAR